MNPANKEAYKNFMENKAKIASGEEKAFSLGVGLHPEGGPFLVLTFPKSLTRIEGEAVQWLMPAEDAKIVIDLLLKGMTGLANIVLSKIVEEAGDPSATSH